ncbi:DUF4423 domain-containing protein [Polyangium sp. y55x31]|uniref:DUF4423 domain-containing protein n=1 Tax=Polyangium sp. y55x31 TaxID=3042688 RepID=UPI00248292B9|nr:DUF4423 domain-containing protein [Polyangium sp. y55x31]MDI1479288.1 DUF4423 domain-containing protein [Polyangium sp. y55x31]
MRYKKAHYDEIAKDFCRALRGRRSQRQLSGRLGYGTNVAFGWESGRRFPTLPTLLRVAAYNGVDVHRALAEFVRQEPALGAGVAVSDPALTATFFQIIKGGLSNAEIGSRIGRSASQVSRFMAGTSQPRLPDVLAIVDATTDRLLDFLALFVPPNELPSVARDFLVLEERRRIATELPWSHAVLRVLELASYDALPGHDDAWVAARLGLAEDEVRACLEALSRAGLLQWCGARYVATAETVDMTRGPAEPRQRLKAHWLDVAARRQRRGDPGLYSYNLISVARRDLERLRALHVRYFHELRQIVSDSREPDCVALVAMQLLELGA